MEQRQLINHLSQAVLDMDSPSGSALMRTLGNENWNWDVIDSRMYQIHDDDGDQRFEQGDTGFDLWSAFSPHMRSNFEFHLMKRMKKSMIGKARFLPFPDRLNLWS